MKTVRLFVSEPLVDSESVHYRLPLRIGAHPANDYQLIHPAIAPFQFELDCNEDRFVLRDLGVREDVLVRVAGEMLKLHGRELTTAAEEIEFAVGGTWVRACVEVHDLPPICQAIQKGIDELVAAYRDAPGLVDQQGALRALTALGGAGIVLRQALRAELDRPLADRPTLPTDAIVSLMRWVQAALIAVELTKAIISCGAECDAR